MHVHTDSIVTGTRMNMTIYHSGQIILEWHNQCNWIERKDKKWHRSTKCLFVENLRKTLGKWNGLSASLNLCLDILTKNVHRTLFFFVRRRTWMVCLPHIVEGACATKILNNIASCEKCWTLYLNWINPNSSLTWYTIHTLLPLRAYRAEVVCVYLNIMHLHKQRIPSTMGMLSGGFAQPRWVCAR